MSRLGQITKHLLLGHSGVRSGRAWLECRRGKQLLARAVNVVHHHAFCSCGEYGECRVLGCWWTHSALGTITVPICKFDRFRGVFVDLRARVATLEARSREDIHWSLAFVDVFFAVVVATHVARGVVLLQQRLDLVHHARRWSVVAPTPHGVVSAHPHVVCRAGAECLLQPLHLGSRRGHATAGDWLSREIKHRSVLRVGFFNDVVDYRVNHDKLDADCFSTVSEVACEGVVPVWVLPALRELGVLDLCGNISQVIVISSNGIEWNRFQVRGIIDFLKCILKTARVAGAMNTGAIKVVSE
eukprot:m.463735 g.463735  ORF g.463735 m.463735 type:complete len:300 (-) comp21611_c0_seq24:254-1153(-)